MISLIIKKYWFHIAAAAAIAILALSLNKAIEAKKDYKDAYIGVQAEAQHYKDQNNLNVTKIEELALSHNTLMYLKDSTIHKLIKENEYMGIKLRKTEQLLGIQTSTSDTILVPLVDTMFVYNAHQITKLGSYYDGFLTMRVGLTENENGKDSLLVDYVYKEDLIVSGYWERDKRKFFAVRWLYPKKHYVSVKSTNPKTMVDGLRYVKFKKNER